LFIGLHLFNFLTLITYKSTSFYNQYCLFSLL